MAAGHSALWSLPQALAGWGPWGLASACTALPHPQPRTYCRMPEVNGGRALGCWWGDPQGTVSLPWRAGKMGGRPHPRPLTLLPHWGSCPGSSRCLPSLWALWGRGRLQLDLECESKHSRTAISPRETFGSINKTAGPTALPCQPHTPDGGWVEDRRGPQPSWTL